MLESNSVTERIEAALQKLADADRVRCLLCDQLLADRTKAFCVPEHRDDWLAQADRQFGRWTMPDDIAITSARSLNHWIIPLAECERYDQWMRDELEKRRHYAPAAHVHRLLTIPLVRAAGIFLASFIDRLWFWLMNVDELTLRPRQQRSLVRRAIKKELPRGANRTDVRRFLLRYNWGPENIYGADPPGTVHGRGPGDVRMKFFFDDAERLSSVRVWKWVDSL